MSIIKEVRSYLRTASAWVYISLSSNNGFLKKFVIEDIVAVKPYCNRCNNDVFGSAVNFGAFLNSEKIRVIKK